jgi:hypothetical protein
MSIVIVETEPGTFVRLPKAEADRLGLVATELKPILPQKNKAIKPGKTKKAAEVPAEKAVEVPVEEAAQDEASDE